MFSFFLSLPNYLSKFWLFLTLFLSLSLSHMQTMIQTNSSFRQTNIHSSKNAFMQKYTRLNQTADKHTHTQTDKTSPKQTKSSRCCHIRYCKIVKLWVWKKIDKSATGRKFFFVKHSHLHLSKMLGFKNDFFNSFVEGPAPRQERELLQIKDK